MRQPPSSPAKVESNGAPDELGDTPGQLNWKPDGGSDDKDFFGVPQGDDPEQRPRTRPRRTRTSRTSWTTRRASSRRPASRSSAACPSFVESFAPWRWRRVPMSVVDIAQQPAEEDVDNEKEEL